MNLSAHILTAYKKLIVFEVLVTKVGVLPPPKNYRALPLLILINALPQ